MSNKQQEAIVFVFCLVSAFLVALAPSIWEVMQ